VKVYAGTDPLTGREIRFRKTCKTERAAQIELGKLLEQATAGRQPDSAVTVAQLLDQYVSTAEWDVSTRESNLGYIRRTIKPALGSTQIHKVRGVQLF
jgi:integrase